MYMGLIPEMELVDISNPYSMNCNSFTPEHIPTSWIMQ